MKLSQALQIVARHPLNSSDVPATNLVLACSFTPLHLRTFLEAHLISLSPDTRFDIRTGLYGDLAGTLRDALSSKPSSVVAAIEWDDLDPRLGFRSPLGCLIVDFDSVSAHVESRLVEMEQLIRKLADDTKVIVSLPDLPLPPVFLQPPSQLGQQEADLKLRLASFAVRIAKLPSVRVASCDQGLGMQKLDLSLLASSGFPYRVDFADALARSFASLIVNRPPLKGIITDLDNTLWKGILGEDGVDKIAWDIDSRAQQHAMYQALLVTLATSGTLVAIASKNDPKRVGEAFEQRELISTKETFFPIEANWGPKSASISRILEIWNISADSVAFVDDSPMELGEVQSSFPEIKTYQFPEKLDERFVGFLHHLRDDFGKTQVTFEDSIRSQSIRSAADQVVLQAECSPSDFLRRSQAKLKIEVNIPDARSLELINKTNQFNLNGRRVADGAWERRLASADHYLIGISYSDRFGPLGKVSVLSGIRNNTVLKVSSWVLSCRAFSRQVEYETLDFIFNQIGIDQIEFDYHATDRNAPLTSCLKRLLGIKSDGELPTGAPVVVTKEVFQSNSPELYAEVICA